MAKLLSDNLTYVSFPINKFEEDQDGNLVVTGTVTDGSVDSDRQVVDPTFSGKALTDWMDSGPNVRVMHSPSLYPAGRGLQVELGDSAHQLKALVVEDTAKKLVRSKVLRAYSVGIADPVIKRDPTGKAPGGVIVGGTLAEVSLVDRPANKNCQLVLAKSADLDTPWTYGDLSDLLAKAEADEAVKGKKHPVDQPGDVEDAGDDLVDEDDDTDDPETDDDEPDPVRKAYKDACDQWRSREPRPHAEAAESGTAFLAKQAAQSAWRRWDAEGETEGLDGSDAGYARWVAKRDVNPNVGGGTDVDQIPAGDFVDPKGRRFPIKTPSDVSDAVSSYGRAKPLIPMKKFRARLTAIARRKGPDFVAQLPESWKTGKPAEAAADVTKDITTISPDPAGLAPYNLVGATKGMKDCPQCEASYDADSKLKRCTNCGAKLPKATKGGQVTDVQKKRDLPTDTNPAGGQGEPDGTTTVEELEYDAGMPTDPDATPDKVPASVKAGRKKGRKPFPGAAAPFGGGDGEPDADDTATKGATTYQVKRMHDATCAAYHWDAVAGEYPALKSVADAVVPAFFAAQVRVAAVKGDMASIGALAALAQEADIVAKGQLDPAVLADGRALVHKAFADMYPDATLKPGAPPAPGQFQRPYIHAGHAPLSASPAAAVSSVPPGTHVPDPNDFDRGYITAGHATESPSNKGNNLDTPNVSTGAARTYYRNASKDAARQAMQAMHDHIAATFPDMCPMAASKSVLPPDNGAGNRPTPVKPLDTAKAPGEKSADGTLLKAKVGLTGKALNRRIKTIRKAAAADAVKAVAATYETKLAALQTQLDELGAQPDPTQAPLRGAVRKAAPATATTPVVTIVEKAQAHVAAEVQDEVTFVTKFLNHPDPQKRAEAEGRLRRLLTAN